MRTGSIGCRDGGCNSRLACKRQPMHGYQLWVQSKGIIELKGTTGFAEAGYRNIAPQARILWITDRRRDRETVHRSPANDDNQLALRLFALGSSKGTTAQKSYGKTKPCRC